MRIYGICIAVMLMMASYLFGRVQALNEARPQIEAAYELGSAHPSVITGRTASN